MNNLQLEEVGVGLFNTLGKHYERITHTEKLTYSLRFI